MYETSANTKCNYLYGWIKNQSYAKFPHPPPFPPQKKVNPRAIAGNAEEVYKMHNSGYSFAWNVFWKDVFAQ